MRLLYQGLLRSAASWARVGRGYVQAFLDLGVDFAVLAPRGFRYEADFAVPEGFREISAAEARRLPPPEVGLGFLHPPLLGRLLGERKANLFVWESDRVPAEWVRDLERHADLVVVPSRFTREALVRSGLPAERVAVVPYGHEAGLAGGIAAGMDGGAGGRGEAGRRFTFLSVAAPHERKGIRQLLGAYATAFRGEEGVLLRVKTTYDPSESRRPRPFEIPGWREVLEASGLAEPGSPRVEIDPRRLDDREMLDLYREADVYVQATWGESFGLALLDALAMGVPAIATGWGGHMEYFPGGSDAVPYRLEEGGDRLYERAPGARVAVPDESALAERLRWHRDHREESRAAGAAARRAVESLTWEASARKLLEVLRPPGREESR